MVDKGSIYVSASAEHFDLDKHQDRLDARSFGCTIECGGLIGLGDAEVLVDNGSIFIPVSVEHVDLDKYDGDAGSFGYHFDKGFCTIINYEKMHGVLADDTVALYDRCKEIKLELEKPDFDNLVDDHAFDISTVRDDAKLLVEYNSQCLYETPGGLYFKKNNRGIISVVTNTSTQEFLDVNTEYTKNVKLHNKLFVEAQENIKLLKSINTSDNVVTLHIFNRSPKR